MRNKLITILGIFIIITLLSCSRNQIFNSNIGNSNSELLTISHRGGMCTSTCISEIKFYSDGRITRQVNDIKIELHLTDEELMKMKTAISTTNFIKIQNTNFHGTCPTESDRGEAIFKFYFSDHDISLPQCKYSIDSSIKVFELINIYSIKYFKTYLLI